MGSMSDAQLELARQVHYAFLPSEYADDHIEVTVTAVPYSGLGGDYCGVVPLSDGKVALTACDATGHDVASALFAARINTYVLSRVATQEPRRLIESLNGFLAARMGSTNMQATLCAAILDPEAACWDFTGAGHPAAIHYRAETMDTVRVKSQTALLGVFDTLQCTTTRSDFEVGDRILLFTDGLVETRDAEGAMFGLDRLQACVVEHAELSGRAFNDAIFAAACAHGVSDLEDDALLVTAKRR